MKDEEKRNGPGRHGTQGKMKVINPFGAPVDKRAPDKISGNITGHCRGERKEYDRQVYHFTRISMTTLCTTSQVT